MIIIITITIIPIIISIIVTTTISTTTIIIVTVITIFVIINIITIITIIRSSISIVSNSIISILFYFQRWDALQRRCWDKLGSGERGHWSCSTLGIRDREQVKGDGGIWGHPPADDDEELEEQQGLAQPCPPVPVPCPQGHAVSQPLAQHLQHLPRQCRDLRARILRPGRDRGAGCDPPPAPTAPPNPARVTGWFRPRRADEEPQPPRSATRGAGAPRGVWGHPRILGSPTGVTRVRWGDVGHSGGHSRVLGSLRDVGSSMGSLRGAIWGAGVTQSGVGGHPAMLAVT